MVSSMQTHNPVEFGTVSPAAWLVKCVGGEGATRKGNYVYYKTSYSENENEKKKVSNYVRRREEERNEIYLNIL